MRTIIAMGGGGFLMEPDNLALDRYIAGQSSKPRPRVCFLPTASGDSAETCVAFYKAFTSLGCEPSVLRLFPMPPTPDLEPFVMAHDVIYVGGGNTRNLLALWREWGLDQILRKAWEAGIVLAGISAGMNCWFESCVTDSVSLELGALACLGFLPGSACPHLDGEVRRRPRYEALMRQGALGAGYAAEDGAAIHFTDDHVHAVVTSRPHARAYRCELVDGEFVQRELPWRYLGGQVALHV